MSKYTSYRRGRKVRRYLANLFLGLFVIAVGVGYLGNYVEALPWSGFTLFFPGWGALFLIVPAIYFLIRSPFSWFWPICLLIGVLILISKLEIYPVGTAVAIGLCALVILVGLRIIFAPLFKRSRYKKTHRMVRGAMENIGLETDGNTFFADGNGNYSVTFGSQTIVSDGQDFSSATLNVSFGEMTLDLTKANIIDCAVIDANCSFGELVIKVPDHVRVEMNRSGAFSEISCKHKNPKDENAPVVYVNADCSFGEIRVE